MWFASIWVFTLGLPWALGADFFMRHLLDGDLASNTLSWRWVAGLHTPGKTYLATADTIAANTDGRFHPQGLARQAHRVEGLANPAPKQPPALADWDATRPFAVLLHEEDLTPDWLLPATAQPIAAAFALAMAARSPLIVAERVQAFVKDAVDDAAQRLAKRIATKAERLTADEVLKDWAVSTGASQIVTPYAPLGPVSEMLDRLQRALEPKGISLIWLMRPWDAGLWPHATQGFFRFRDAVQST